MATPAETVDQNVGHIDRIESLGLAARKAMVLETIAQRLSDTELESSDLGMGQAGPALFFFELYKRLGKPADLLRAKYHLGRILDGISQIRTFDLYAGFAGVGWLLNHLKTLDVSNELELAPDCCADVDELLLDLVGTSGWPHHYELISGLVGIGVYALDHPDAVIRARLYGCVLDRLIETSEPDDGGTAWKSQNRFLPNADERMRYPNGNFNLGIAHGVPGVIALLGKGLSQGIEIDRCEPLLRRSVSWLLSAGANVTGIPSFGYLAGDGKQARVAWCYGDLSVAIAMLRAARGLNDQRLSAIAIDIATRVLDRGMVDSGVQDASLCHGSQGNAHICRRLFQWTGHRRFLEACSIWESATVAPWIMSPESSGGMYLPCKWVSDAWKQDNGYLMGLSGIGLSLADGLYGLSGSWDVPLMTEL